MYFYIIYRSVIIQKSSLNLSSENYCTTKGRLDLF